MQASSQASLLSRETLPWGSFRWLRRERQESYPCLKSCWRTPKGDPISSSQKRREVRATWQLDSLSLHLPSSLLFPAPLSAQKAPTLDRLKDSSKTLPFPPHSLDDLKPERSAGNFMF